MFSPQVKMAQLALRELVKFHKATTPDAIVPDGRGGWVSADNSTYDPATGRFNPR